MASSRSTTMASVGVCTRPTESIFVVGQRVGAREVHAHQPVGAAAAAGGVGQADRNRGRAQGVEALADGVRRERGDPQAADRLGALRGLVDVAEDQFAFAAGVRGAHDARDLGRVEDLLHGLELVLGLLVDDQRPLRRAAWGAGRAATAAIRD